MVGSPSLWEAFFIDRLGWLVIINGESGMEDAPYDLMVTTNISIANTVEQVAAWIQTKGAV
jgi:hypothetical protein